MNPSLDITSSNDLSALTALVTGSAKGIGNAIARELGRRGARVAITDIDEATLQEAVTALTEAGIECLPAVLDVSDEDSCATAYKWLCNSLGSIDILVNAAGVYSASKFLEASREDFQRLLNVNLFGTLNMMQLSLPSMQSRRFGRIINIASTAGKWGAANQSTYGVSKHAVIGLTRCVAMEFAKSGVTVNAVCPGPVETVMLTGLLEIQANLNKISPQAYRDSLLARVPMGRLIEPQEVALAAAYFASPHAGAVTGQAFTVDGGLLQG